MAKARSIRELSAVISDAALKIDDYLASNNLPAPSLDASAPPALPISEEAKDVKAAQSALLEACSELKDLITGPQQLLRFNWTAFVSTKAIIRFNLDKAFPVGEERSFEALAEASGLTPRTVRRIIRHGILNHHLFEEPSPGVIRHSALTAFLNKDEGFRAWLSVALDEFWPAAVKAVDAMEKWPNSEEPNQTGFSLANNSDKSMYEIFSENPSRAQKFGKAMSFPDDPPEALLENYPWEEKKLVIDVGGSHGSIPINIANRFPSVKCIVQDLPDVVAEGEALLPLNLKDRVTFMAYDFFTPQTVSADVYYFRSIFHNWSDKYCIKILRNLIPALKPGARVLINERILPDLSATPAAAAKRVVNLDIGMLQLLNAHQREMDEWQDLFARADPRFRYVGAYQPPGAVRWIIEAEWQE